MDDDVIASLESAVAAAPQDVTLRLHLARLLVDHGQGDAALPHLAQVLAARPESPDARALMARALGAGEPRTEPPATPSPFDWQEAERELGGADAETLGEGTVDGSVDRSDPTGPRAAYDVERGGVRLEDVGGMEKVKERLEMSFLAPLRNPELRTLYRKSLRGGLLLYGPPGCGKTFLARAVAGELDAGFLTVSLADVLDMYIGSSEKNVQELFKVARASAPCVLFLDELDALGQKRSMTRSSGMRTTVNQLLTELDGIGTGNEGVYVLAATNQPWDVDPALRRPGRLDRTLLVLPPDRDARAAILGYHLRERPVERVDVRALAKRTEGYSGADLAHLCDTATERALLASARSGRARRITMDDLVDALGEVRPSIGPWLETARNVALFANGDGEYDELATYLRKQRRL